MCISITEANAIHISMHSQWYDTLKIHMKQLPMWYDSPMQCNPISIRFNKMQYDVMEKTYDAMQFNMVQIACFYFFGSDIQEIIN